VCIYQKAGIVIKTAVPYSPFRVELQVERSRQLRIPLLLLTARTRGLLFQTLKLACRALALILASVPRVHHWRRRRRRSPSCRGRRRLWFRFRSSARTLWAGSAGRKREGCLVAPE